jgi:hypothetical protein
LILELFTRHTVEVTTNSRINTEIGVGSLCFMTADALTLDPIAPPDRRPGNHRWHSGFVDLTVIVASAFRLLWRHWPVLVALSFAGMALRGGATWVAVTVSAHNSILGMLLFMLVPLGTLIALTLMLRVLRESLRSVRDVPSTQRTFDMAGNVLVPFLAVYAAYGYLNADKEAYAYATWDADWFSSTRTHLHLTTLAIVVIVAAYAGRSLLDRPWARRHGWLGIVRAYLEIVWIAVLAIVIYPLHDKAMALLESRRVVHGAFIRLDSLGSTGTHIHGVLDWIGSLLSTADTAIATPVAWLTVGAIVYGRELTVEPRKRDRASARALTRRWVRLPKLVRRGVMSLRESVGERFGPLIDGLRVVFRAGLLPMLLFCLVFQVVQATSTWLFLVERALIGPRDLAPVWMRISPPLSAVTDAIAWVALICLLGAATDRVLGRIAPAAEPDAEPSVTTDDASTAVVAETSPDPAADVDDDTVTIPRPRLDADQQAPEDPVTIA